MLNIQVGTKTLGTSAFHFFDMADHIIKANIISISDNIIQVCVSGLAPGVYLYRIDTPQGTIVKRFIKQ